jgi:ASC-1-like (ASCH) protein
VLKRTIEGNPHDLSKEHLDVLKARAAKLEAKVAKAKAKAKQGKAQDAASVGDSELKDFVIKVRRPQTTRAVELTFTAATPADASLAAKKQGFLLLSDPVLKRMANDAAFSAYGVVRDRRLLKEFATKAEAEKWAASEPGSKVTKITVPGRDVAPVGDAGTTGIRAGAWVANVHASDVAPVGDDAMAKWTVWTDKGMVAVKAASSNEAVAAALRARPGAKVDESKGINGVRKGQW